MFINRRTSQQTVIHPYNGTLFSSEEGRTADKYSNLDESQKHRIKEDTRTCTHTHTHTHAHIRVCTHTCTHAHRHTQLDSMTMRCKNRQIHVWQVREWVHLEVGWNWLQDRMKGLSGVMKMIYILFGVVISWVFTNTKTHQTEPLRSVPFMVYKL